MFYYIICTRTQTHTRTSRTMLVYDRKPRVRGHADPYSGAGAVFRPAGAKSVGKWTPETPVARPEVYGRDVRKAFGELTLFPFPVRASARRDRRPGRVFPFRTGARGGGRRPSYTSAGARAPASSAALVASAALAAPVPRRCSRSVHPCSSRSP